MRRLVLFSMSIIVLVLLITGIAKQASAATPTPVGTVTETPIRTRDSAERRCHGIWHLFPSKRNFFTAAGNRMGFTS